MDKLLTVRAAAKVFDDGLLGIKTRTELPPGDYAAVIVLMEATVPAPAPTASAPDEPFEPLDEFVERMRKQHVEAALARVAGNRTQAARILRVDPRTVFRYLEGNE